MLPDRIAHLEKAAPLTSAAADRAPPANPLASLAQGIILSWGWRRHAIAFASGAIGALALAPFSLIAAMAAPLTVAVWLIDGSAAGRRTIGGLGAAFSAGWWWGFGYFVAGLWWVGMACLVDVEKFAWAMPLGVLALPAGLALFPGLRVRVGAASLDAGADARARAGARSGAFRMGPRPHFHRISLERPRHVARRQSDAGADRLACRSARADVHGHRDLRCSRDALADRREPVRLRADVSCRARAGAHRGFRVRQAHDAGQPDRAGREAPPHSA